MFKKKNTLLIFLEKKDFHENYSGPALFSYYAFLCHAYYVWSLFVFLNCPAHTGRGKKPRSQGFVRNIFKAESCSTLISFPRENWFIGDTVELRFM